MIPNVHDRATAEQFVKACVAEIGLGFHPDTRFEDYVDGDGRRVFPDAEAERLNLMADRAAGFVDLYAVGLAEMRKLDRRLRSEREDLTSALESILTDARYALSQLRRGGRQWGTCWDTVRRAIDALERIESNAGQALRPADATPAAGSCEHCAADGGGCIVCQGWTPQTEGK
jgi:hypothetical protein